MHYYNIIAISVQINSPILRSATTADHLSPPPVEFFFFLNLKSNLGSPQLLLHKELNQSQLFEYHFNNRKNYFSWFSLPLPHYISFYTVYNSYYKY